MTVLAVAQPIAVQHVVAPGALARQAMARAGESVAKFLKRHRWRFDLDTILVINGRPVLRRDDGWKTRRFAPGDVVRFVSRPFGGQQGKQIGGLIALIALTVFASWAIGPTLAGSALLATVTKAVIVAGGMMLYNTLVYPKPGNRSDEDNLYSFNAAGNTARPLETIPDAYGRLQRDLDYAAIPYKTYSGNVEYFQGLFMIGDGRYEHEALLVDDIEFWTAEAAATDGTGTGPGGTVPDGSLFWTNDEGDRPTSPGVLDPFEDIQIEFIEPGEPVTLFPTNVHQSADVNGLEFDHPGSAGGGWSPWFPVCNPNDVTNLIHLDIALPNGFSRNNHDTFADYTVEIRPIDAAGAATGAAVSTTRRYSGLHRKPHRFTHSFPQAVAQRYALRFRRDAEPTTGDNTDFYAAGLRAEIPGETVFPEGTMVAVRIKATKQLSDYSSRRIRYRGTRILPVWTGSAWEEQPTRNPIWAAINLRSNADYGGKLPLERFQLDEWIAAAAAADARGDCFDHEFKNAVKVGEAVDLAFGAARSKHRWYGHILGLVRDEWQASPRMLVTDREMVAGSFSLTANFRDENAPDGLIVNYIDQETWRPAQVVVPIGSSPVNPVTEELRGVTSRAHATREAVFKWNAQVKRRIGPSFTMLLEGHTLNYGDHLDIQSRAPQAWGSAHAVVGLSGSTVRLPRAPQWPDGVTMYAAIRTKTGGLFGPCRVTEGATPRHLVFNDTDLASLLTATGMTLADALDRAPDAAPPTLVMGEAFDFLKRMQVVSVEPRGDKAQVVGFLDAEVVHAPDEVEEAPRPPTLTYPSRNLPRVVSLDARLRQVLFETRLEASWPTAPNATRYVVEVKYDEAVVWVPVYDGPVNACDVVVDNYAMQVRVVPFGDRGAGHASPIVDLAELDVTVPPGSVDWQAFDNATTAGLTAMAAQLKAARDLVEQVTASQQALEQAVLDGAAVQVEKLKSVRGSARAELETVEVALTEADLALTVRMNDAESAIGANTASINTLETTKITEAQSLALAEQVMEAVFGAGSAGVKMRLGAVAGPHSYLAYFEVEASITGDDGTYKATGQRIAIYDDGGTVRSKIQNTADRSEWLDATGAPFVVFDAATRTVLFDRFKSGDFSEFFEFARAEPGSHENVGTGNTSGGIGNTYLRFSSLGTLTVPENPGSIGDGASGSDFCPVAVLMDIAARNTTNGWNGGSYNPMVVAYRLELDDGAGGVYVSREGLCPNYSGYSPSGGIVIYGFGMQQSVLVDIFQAKAGTYNVYLARRWGPTTANGMQPGGDGAGNGMPLKISSNVTILLPKR